MIEQVKSPRFLTLTLLVLAAACTRALPLLIPHVWNFTAIGALAVFAGSQFKNRYAAMIMPLAAMALSDLFLGHGFIKTVYAGFIVMVLCGMFIRNKVSVTNVGFASIAGALAFFLITNFALLYSEAQYPHTLGGVITSYVMALPFLRNMLIGDVVYGAILFGSFYYLQKRYPSIAYSK
ncbi:MAG: hypothetical protein K0S09_1508 [Sphingobacteriaceae bacterium]|jgi:hypothetical protein|nr:hypothetical protein [Sphingobacteriaceae bacterium]